MNKRIILTKIEVGCEIEIASPFPSPNISQSSEKYDGIRLPSIDMVIKACREVMCMKNSISENYGTNIF